MVLHVQPRQQTAPEVLQLSRVAAGDHVGSEGWGGEGNDAKTQNLGEKKEKF